MALHIEGLLMLASGLQFSFGLVSSTGRLMV